MPKHKKPNPTGHEIYNFGRPFLGHLYYILSLSDLCLGVEFKKYIILHFLPPNNLPLKWEGVMNFTISCLLTLQMLHTKFGKDCPSSS